MQIKLTRKLLKQVIFTAECGYRYDEARGDRESAYQGRYEITGNRINYWDDTGFTADGEFRDGVLYHGGYVFYPLVEQR
ncbi:hypothetical protein HC928_14795 [bacterium]|nr:hypothetical protein [bacterium]